MLGMKRKEPARETIESRLALTLDGVAEAPASVQSMSADGARLVYPTSTCPDLAVGQAIDLQVAAPEFTRPLTVSAIVHHRVEMDGDRMFDFRFLDPIAFKKALPDELRQLIDHRHAYRVQPDTASPVDVTVNAPSMGLRAQAVLADISITGIGISVTAGVECELRSVNKIELSFRLAPSHRLLKVMGYVRHRRLASDGIRYGIEMDARLTEDFEECVELVREYIRWRHQQVFESVIV